MSLAYKQDMPPKGGYKDFVYGRGTPVKKYNGLLMLTGLAGYMVWKYWYISSCATVHQRDNIRNEADARVALTPFLHAEFDRQRLKRQREMRDVESEVMKDVPGWQVGKLYGENLYSNQNMHMAMYSYMDEAWFSRTKAPTNKLSIFP